MPTQPELESIAREIRVAQEAVLQIEPFTARVPGFDIPAAYAVADLMHAARISEGAVPVGRKIGFTNPDMWASYGVREPIWARLYDASVVHLDGDHGTCRLAGFAEPKVEPEIVFRLRSTPPAGAGPAQMLECVDWVAHAFEIVQSHFPGWRFQAADTVADSALHAALLIGPRRDVGDLGEDPVAALERFSLALFCDGRELERGRGSNVLGSPLSALAHLVSVLARQPAAAPLQAGEVVTTGTITRACSVRPGETWHSEVEGIGLPGLTVGFV